MPKVILPARRSGQPPVTIDVKGTIVIVGANGSGKTRFGAFIEQHNSDTTHRISAQRSLVVPTMVQPKTYEQAQSALRFGTYHPQWNELQHAANKNSHRWGGNPYVSMLNDYEHLLAALFAEEEKRNRDYTRAAVLNLPQSKPPASKLDELQGL
mgnify:CR=1 FL=1